MNDRPQKPGYAPLPSNGNDGPSAMAKWMFAIFILVVLYAGYALFLKPTPKTAPPAKKQAATFQVTKPAATFKQEYGTTLTYNSQAVTIQKVELLRLDKNTADVTYTITAVPIGGSRWLHQKKTWLLGRTGSTRRPYRVSVSTLNRGNLVVVRFRTRTPRLEQGSYLQIRFPKLRNGKERGATNIRFGLEISDSHRTIPERSGIGGF